MISKIILSLICLWKIKFEYRPFVNVSCRNSSLEHQIELSWVSAWKWHKRKQTKDHFVFHQSKVNLALTRHHSHFKSKLSGKGIKVFLLGQMICSDLKDKFGGGIIDDKIQNNTVINGESYFFSLFFPSPYEITNSVKRSAWNEAISHCENKSVPLFSCLLIVASPSIVCTCMKKTTKRRNVALIIKTFIKLTAVWKLTMWNNSKNSRQ